MNKIIQFSQKTFSRRLLLIIVISAVICILLAFLLKEYKELVYFLSVLICGTAILILFHSTRFYPHILSILDSNMNIEYLNKSFFRQKPFSGNVEDISIEKKGKELILYQRNEKRVIAIINENSISKEDEDELIRLIKT